MLDESKIGQLNDNDDGFDKSEKSNPNDYTPYLAKPDIPDDVEKRVVRQFVEALLFERIVNYKKSKKDAIDKYEAIYDYNISFEVADLRFIAVATCRAFERIRIAQGSLKCLQEQYTTGDAINSNYRDVRLDDLIPFLDLDESAQNRLMSELSQTIALCRWNIENLDHHLSPRRDLSFAELESAITEGHLYHPSFKTRTGFSLKDHRNYGPEAGCPFQLQWLAIKRDELNQALPLTEESFWAQELGEDVFTKMISRLTKAGGSWADFALVPIHPWQFGSIQEKGLADLIKKGDILDLGFIGDFYQATQSLRTILNISNPTKANIKLPLNIVSTSLHRNLYKHFVCISPTISTWLQDMVANDEYLQKENKLILLSEYAGLLYEPEDKVIAKNMDGLIGTIFRESVIDKLETDEEAVPFTAMMLIESDNQPFIAEWLNKYGVEKWVDRLLEVMLIPVWHMLVHHGVALEVHAQNLILIHKNGWPEKIAVRDFHEATEFVQDFLADPENGPKLIESDPFFATVPLNDGFNMESINALTELFMDTAYVFNLVDLSFLIERFFDFSEKDFWTKTQSHLDAYRNSGITDSKRIDLVAADAPKIMVESLLKKKIMNGGTLDWFNHQVANELHRSNK